MQPSRHIHSVTSNNLALTAMRISDLTNCALTAMRISDLTIIIQCLFLTEYQLSSAVTIFIVYELRFIQKSTVLIIAGRH